MADQKAAKVNVTIVQARNLASSRTLYCEVNVVDENGKTVGAPKKTQKTKGTNQPSFNSTFTFEVEEGFSGICVRVFEFQRFFADKFLGIVRLKFNVKRLLAGKDKVDSWFTLSSPKKRNLGDIEVKVEPTQEEQPQGKRTKIKTKRRDSDDDKLDKEKEDDDDDDDEGTKESRPPPITSKALWNSQNVKLEQQVVVQIDDENGEGATLRPREDGKKKKPTTEDGGEKNGEKNGEKDDKKPEGKEKKVPTSRKGQVELIMTTVKNTPNSVVDEITFDDNYDNISFKCVDRKKNQVVDVVLIVPEDIRKGEYMLWARDGGIELGCTGSILRAFNKIITIFAAKNSVEPIPVFPEPYRNWKSTTLPSSWAEIKPAEEKKTTTTKPEGKEENDRFDFKGDYIVDEWDLNGDYQDEGEQEFLTQPKLNFQKFVEKFKGLHKDVSNGGIGVIQEANGDIVSRLLLKPSVFLEQILATVWHIKYDKPIVIELSVSGPYFMENRKPPVVSVYQTDQDVTKQTCTKETFGLAWFLTKRLEEFLRNNWPPGSNYNLFLDMVSFTTDKVLHCADNCLICGKQLEFCMLKPSICDQAVCVFGMEQYGLGVDPVAEIHASPECVDLLISFTMASSVGMDAKRFTPFPKHIEVTSRDKNGKEVKSKLQQNPLAEPSTVELNEVTRVINLFPSVADMAKFKTSKELKEHMDKIDPLCYPLLRWILTSTRAHLAKLKDNEKISEMGTKHQFLLLSSTPAREKKFQEEKKKKGSFYAFHGSAFNNWHSIMRQGLKNLSGTALMSAGQAYGAGIYMATESNTSIGYARAGNGWQKSMFNEDTYNSNFQCLALCEVISGYTANPYYVVPNEDHVVTRYLFLFNSRNAHQTVYAANVKPPSIEFMKYQKQF